MHARLVARLREHGYSLDEIKQAGDDGRLAFGYVDELFPPRVHRDAVPGFEQIARHGRAHCAQPDEPKFRHAPML